MLLPHQALQRRVYEKFTCSIGSLPECNFAVIQSFYFQRRNSLIKICFLELCCGRYVFHGYSVADIVFLIVFTYLKPGGNTVQCLNISLIHDVSESREILFCKSDP